MAAGHVNTLTSIQYNSTASAGVSNHSINFFYQMFDTIDAETNIINHPDQFHTHSYQRLLDGIIWYTISMIMVILLYGMSRFTTYPGCDDIESAGFGLFYAVILLLKISIFMILTSTKPMGRGLCKIQMVLTIDLRYNINNIFKRYTIIVRILYECMNEL
eukprot:266200_1